MNTIIETTSIVNPEAVIAPEAPAAETTSTAKKTNMKATILTAAAVTGGIAGGIMISRQVSKYATARAMYAGLVDEIREILYGETCKQVPDSTRICILRDATTVCDDMAKRMPMFHNRASESEFHRTAATIYQRLINCSSASRIYAGQQSVLNSFGEMAAWHTNMADSIDMTIVNDPGILGRAAAGFQTIIRQPMSARKIRKMYGDRRAEAADFEEDQTTV